MKKIIVILAVISCAFLLLLGSARHERVVNELDIVGFISGTFSHSNFTTGQISDQMIQQILAAGHQAGSAGNQQHWHFTVVRNKELIDEIMENVDEGNVL